MPRLSMLVSPRRVASRFSGTERIGTCLLSASLGCGMSWVGRSAPFSGEVTRQTHETLQTLAVCGPAADRCCLQVNLKPDITAILLARARAPK